MSAGPKPSRLQRAALALKLSKLSHVLALAAGALLAAGVTVAVTDDGGGHRTVTVHVGAVATQTKVDTADAGLKADATITAPATAVRQAAASPELAAANNLRNEAPAGVTLKQLSDSLQAQEKLAFSDQLPIVQPDAAPSQRGCLSRFVQNYSSRRGVAPREWTLHFTVSPNRPGWADVFSVVNLFNTASFQASSNYVIDGEGNCAYIVRESDKAWTQASGNPYSISVEVIDTGKESEYLAPAGLRKLAMVISDSAARWHIPIQHGSVNGCVPSKAGIIQHRDWGACGGGHFDISPFSVDKVITAVRAYRASQADPCSATCKRMRPRHRRIHAALKTPPTHAARVRLVNRNAYLHRYARAHKFTL